MCLDPEHHAREAKRIQTELDSLSPGDFPEHGIVRTILRDRVAQELRRADGSEPCAVDHGAPRWGVGKRVLVVDGCTVVDHALITKVTRTIVMTRHPMRGHRARWRKEDGYGYGRSPHSRHHIEVLE